MEHSLEWLQWRFHWNDTIWIGYRDKEGSSGFQKVLIKEGRGQNQWDNQLGPQYVKFQD